MKRIQNPIVPHCYSSSYGNFIELSSKTAHPFYFSFDNLADIMQMHMTGNKLGKRINHCDNRIAKMTVFHAVRPPECPGSGHPASFCRYRTSEILFHESSLYI